MMLPCPYRKANLIKILLSEHIGESLEDMNSTSILTKKKITVWQAYTEKCNKNMKKENPRKITLPTIAKKY